MKSRQKGGVLILVGISLAVLIGFLGIVVDLGHLFVTKTELQSAMDACALAAAAELKPGIDPPDTQAIARAVSAGITAGTRNKVDLQSAAATIGPANIYFSDRLSYNLTFPFGYVQSTDPAVDSATARYVLCASSRGGIATWFMQVLESFLGAPSTANTVGAWATATLQPAQLACAIPIGLCNPLGEPATQAEPNKPFIGMTEGKWFRSKTPTPQPPGTGSFDWIDFTPDGGGGASELADLLKGSGQCNVPTVGTQVGQQGNIESLDKAWNTRFGLYKGSDTPATATPDYTGYAYTPLNWDESVGRAFNDTTNSGAKLPGVVNYSSSSPWPPGPRAENWTYQGTPGQGYWSATPDQLAKGASRRVVTVPVVNCEQWAGTTPQTIEVLGYACVLMLHPMTHSSDPLYSPEVWLEYLGPANSATSPCSTSGLAGGTAGPLVPVLVH
jgi:Flp pilus assembly protein TadG